MEENLWKGFKPTEEAFQDTELNAYEGAQPGAAMEQAFSTHDASERTCSIFVRSVPDYWREEALFNLFSEFGKVDRIYQPPGKNFRFIHYIFPAEAERAIRKINSRDLPFKADFKREKEEEVNFLEQQRNLIKDIADCSGKPRIRLEQREYKGPFCSPTVTLLPLPERKKFLTLAEYEESGLANVDPKLTFFNEYTAFDFCGDELNQIKIGPRRIQNGRSVFGMDEKQIENALEEEFKQFVNCPGTYDVDENVYCGVFGGIVAPKFDEGLCSVCGDLLTNLKHEDKFVCSQKCVHLLTAATGEQSKEDSAGTFSGLNYKSIESGDDVVITAFLMPDVLYVRPSDTASDREYNSILEAVHLDGRKARPLKGSLKAGDVVAVRTKPSGIFVRALVLKIVDSTRVRCAFLDYGTVAEHESSDIYALSQKSKALPVCISRVQLDDVESERLNKNAFIFLAQLLLLETRQSFEITFEDTLLRDTPVQLSNAQIDLNKLLVEQMAYTFDKDRKNVHLWSVKSESKKRKKIVVTENRVAPTFSFVLAEHLDKLAEIHRAVQHYGRTANFGGNYAPYCHEACVVRVEGDVYYRAECLELVGDKHPTMHFVDFGAIEPIHITNIAPLPVELSDFPIYTSAGTLKGLSQDVPEEMKKVLSEMMQIGAEFTATSITSEEHDYKIVDIPSVMSLYRVALTLKTNRTQKG